MVRAKNFDPSIYGMTLEEWSNLDAKGRFKQVRLRRLAQNPDFERQRYYARVEEMRAKSRRSYWRHLEKSRARCRARHAKDSSLKSIAATPDAVYQQVVKLIPTSLPRDARDDIAGSIVLAVLEGKVLVKDLGKRVSEFVRAHNREFDPYKTRSLNETLPGSKLEWIDTLTEEDRPW